MLDAATNAPRGSQYGNLSIDQYRNPQGEQEIIAAVHNDVVSSEWILAPLHRSWYEAILWTLGEHYLEWNQRTRRFQIRPVRLYVPRAVSNMIAPRVERGVAVFLKSFPEPMYVATTTEAKDRDAAQAATGVMRYRDKVGRIKQKKRDLANWVVTCGTGFMQTRLDRASAERVKRPVINTVQEPMMGADGMPVIGEDGQPQMDEKEIPVLDPETSEPMTEEVVLADEGVEVLSPFEVVPDWNARYPWEMRRYTHVRARTRDWIGREFGSDARESVKPETPMGIVGTMGYYQLKVMDIQMRASLTGSYGLPYGYGGAIADMRYMEDSAVVLARWQLPTDENPKGRLMIVAGGKVLHDGENPHGDRLNLFTYRWMVLPGSVPWGVGMPRNLISPQKRYNGISTQTDIIRKTAGNPWIFADRRSQVSLDLHTSEPMHVFSYRSAPGVNTPTITPAQSSSPDARYQQEQIKRDMDEIAGTEQVLRGVNPTGATAGITVERLEEQASERFVPGIDDNRDEFERMYEMRIEIARQSNAWQFPREVPTIGADGRRAQKNFQASDFTGNIQVECQAVPLTAFSEAMKKQNVIGLIDKGVIDITSERNRDRIRRMFSVQELTEDVDADRRLAQDENEHMYDGQLAVVQPIDDHPTHIDEHTLEMKTDRFMNSTYDVQSRFYQHLMVHVQKMAITPPAPEVQPGGEASPAQPQPGPMEGAEEETIQ